MKMENQFWFLECRENRGEDFELNYDSTKKKWVVKKDYTDYWWPGTYPCRSYRAAKRHLRKHNEIPKGTKFVLVNEFVGFDRVLMK